MQSYPALQKADDPLSPRLATLLRKPFPAQAVAAMGLSKKWERERSAAVIAECGTGKTLISLAAIHVHSDGRPFTAVVMAPGHIILKWRKEALAAIPRLRSRLSKAGRSLSRRRVSTRRRHLRSQRWSRLFSTFRSVSMLRSSARERPLLAPFGGKRHRWRMFNSRFSE